MLENASKQLSRMENLSQQHLATTASSPSQLENHTASAGTCVALNSVQANTLMKTPILAPSVNLLNTTPSHTNVCDPLSHISTPYNTNTWDSYLANTNLTLKYPNLGLKICYGFPISDPDPPAKTTILPNPMLHPNNPKIICNYLDEEMKLGRMTGPFTKEKMDAAVGVTWVASLVFVIQTAGEPHMPEKTHVVINSSKKNEDGVAVNDELSCDDINWGTTADVAEIVSTILHHVQLPPS